MKQVLPVLFLMISAICAGQTKKYAVEKTDAAWKKQLGSIQFAVTRKKETEQPYTGKYWNSHKKGIYTCVCCGQALFSSRHKFSSGTGWPSFWQPLTKTGVEETADNSLGIQRTEVNCSRCGAHLGHVFTDGPLPTGLRYCINSASLRLKPAKK